MEKNRKVEITKKKSKQSKFYRKKMLAFLFKQQNKNKQIKDSSIESSDQSCQGGTAAEASIPVIPGPLGAPSVTSSIFHSCPHTVSIHSFLVF